VKIAPFGVEQWMNEYETRCTYNLAETCVDSLTIAQLLELAGHDDGLLDELLPMKLTYGSIEGTDRLRSAVAALYERQGTAPNLAAPRALATPANTTITMILRKHA
jgi:hypothetical protein